MDLLPAMRRAWLPVADAREPGERVARLTGRQVELLVVDLVDVSQTAVHSHDVEQIVVVLEGSVRMRIGAGEHDLAAGDAVVIPPEVLHAAASAGHGFARVLEVRRIPNTTVGR